MFPLSFFWSHKQKLVCLVQSRSICGLNFDVYVMAHPGTVTAQPSLCPTLNGFYQLRCFALIPPYLIIYFAPLSLPGTDTGTISASYIESYPVVSSLPHVNEFLISHHSYAAFGDSTGI